MIYYLCPDYNIPSWGVGMIYHHVSFLTKNGIEACILHQKSRFRLSWLKLDIPLQYQDSGLRLTESDILIVPDVFIEEKFVRQARCRKFLFVQNAFILFERVYKVAGINAAAFEAVFYYMPHLKKVLQQYFDVPLIETPAFIADYYYKERAELHNRTKQILIYPKFNNRDYSILEKLLLFHYQEDKQSLLPSFFKKKTAEWDLVFIKDMSHEQVAALMKRAAFFVNINTHEAFNSSVPEAMAAGCINITYEAFGPADFLQNNINAYVFANNYIFDLFATLRNLTGQYDSVELQQQLTTVRENAYEVAQIYSMKNAEKEITQVFRSILNKALN